jgi:hypothetical protein
MIRRSWVPALALPVLLAGAASADPPVPDPKNTLCPTVQCMRVTNGWTTATAPSP